MTTLHIHHVESVKVETRRGKTDSGWFSTTVLTATDKDGAEFNIVLFSDQPLAFSTPPQAEPALTDAEVIREVEGRA